MVIVCGLLGIEERRGGGDGRRNRPRNNAHGQQQNIAHSYVGI